MKCEKCSTDVSQRFHDGRWLCSVHKQDPSASAAVTEPRHILAFAQQDEADTLRQLLDSLRTERERTMSDTGLLVSAVQEKLSELSSQINGHELRICAAEATLGSQRSLLGDFFSKADGETQARILADEINKLKARIDAGDTKQEAIIAGVDILSKTCAALHDFGVMRWRGRLRWLFGRSG